MTISPTIERLNHGFVLPPQYDQKTKRRYHRGLDLFDLSYNRGDLDQAQYTAALKLRKHYEGSLGRDVRTVEDFTNELRDLDGVPAQTYHSDKIVEVRKAIRGETWRLLEKALDGCERLDKLGQFILKITNAKKARHYARREMQQGMDQLVKLWGLALHPPTR